ncbi:putative bleomycin hydrolase [Myriangium duriaei CBS 260.36]|uniref:Cysteine proteinase 1, mitochondrial n=1 Tax=Myriangium duriaei CBS 260.36 TaxID=1168546 RepID=A0A9P4ISI5_9PEZI|nr:putative bleomycin hydrolase [Myriangium duriaei CBS 260.36]
MSLNEKTSMLSIDDDSESSIHLSTRQGKVSATDTQAWVQEVLQDPKNRLALSALSTANPATVLEQSSVLLRDAQIFNTAIPHEGAPITNQRSSGRCWIFAATNVFRIALMKKYNIDKFELSQSYLFFWDKVEKANYFLENILDTTKEPVDGRLISALMASPVGDGGQWDMISNLVRKYGLVPQTLYPDSWNAQNSAVMNRLITVKLREDALVLRRLVEKGADKDSILDKKNKMMQDIVRILTITLGPPPARDQNLDWEFYDKSGKLHRFALSPIQLADGLGDSKSVRACGGTDVHSLFSLVNDPRNDYGTLMTVSRLGNVWGGRPVTYVNVDTTTLKSACVAMIKKGFPVFFGSDVGKFSDSGKGIMDVDLVDYKLGFNVTLGLTKGQRLLTGESQMTHAMVLTAVHLSPEGKPIRWRVENSWSESAGDHGYFVASDAWMDEFCYQAVVDPTVVTPEVLDILKQKPKVLPLWDPMG